MGRVKEMPELGRKEFSHRIIVNGGMVSGTKIIVKKE